MKLRIVLLAVCLIINSCQPIHIEKKPYEYEEVPIVYSSGEIHHYSTTQELDLGNDYALYCKSHHRWETISVRYVPTTLTKLRKEEYIVRPHNSQVNNIQLHILIDMWELNDNNIAFNTLLLISGILLISILWEVIKTIYGKKYMDSMNRKPLRQRILEYNKRWREKYE